MLKTLINSYNYYQCNKNYTKKLNKLRSRHSQKPIRVCFLVRENQKWSYQSLYEILEASDMFEPVILISLLWLSHIGKDPTRNNLTENYIFFKEKGMRVQYAYENGQYIDLNKFKPDIVFYDQPWDLPEVHQPQQVSKFALTCYVPYGFSIGNYKKDYTQDFHKLLFRMFLEHDFIKLRYEKLNKKNSKNCIVTGLPKFDEYSKPNPSLESLWQEPDNFKIIYAPHHSLESNGLRFATFKQNGKFILDYAKRHPETTWIFKPHPRFKYALLKNNVMTEAEIEDYYGEWEAIGKIHTTGNYFEIFKTSDLLLTDCCSFLAEYMPSTKPIVQIMNKDHSSLSDMGNLLLQGCYSVVENYEVEEVLNKLMIQGNDEKQKVRANIAQQIYDKMNLNSSKIYNELNKLLDKTIEKEIKNG